MPTTDIFCGRPNWSTNYDAKVGFGVAGDNNVSQCIRLLDTVKYIKVNWYYNRAASWWFYLYDASAIPASVTITQLEGHWYSRRTGGGNGYAQMQHRIGTSPPLTHITSHNPANGAWKTGVMARPGGGSWTLSDLANLQTRIARAGRATSDQETRWDQHFVRVTWTYTSPTGLTSAHKDVTSDGGTVYGSYDANGEANTQYRMEIDTGSGYDSPAWNVHTGTGAKTVEDRVVTGLGPSQSVDYRLAVQSLSGTQYSTPGNFVTDAVTPGMIIF